MTEEGILGAIRIDHIGIAVNTLDEGSKFWRLLGLSSSEEDEVVESQGVSTRFFPLECKGDRGIPRIELLEPLGQETPIGKHIERRGVGFQHICFRVDDVALVLNHLSANGIKLIDESPREGAGGCLVGFVHPKSTGGLLVEFAQKE